MTLRYGPDYVYSADGTRQLELQSGNRSTYTNNTLLSANTYHKVAEVAVSDGSYIFQVSWDTAYSASGGTVIWETCGAASHGVASADSYYNNNGYDLIDFKFTQHYRVITPPLFYLDSDNTLGNYGRLSVYLNCTTAIKFADFQFNTKRIMTKIN